MTAPTLTLFPEPDSPRIPTVSPRPMAKLTPRTASTTPCGVWNETRRFETASSAPSLTVSAAAATGVTSATATAGPDR